MLAWSLAAADPERSSALAHELGLRPVTAQLLINRGFHDGALARRYLSPRLVDLRRPDGEAAMAGFERAVERLLRALEAGETIGLYGDYDVDGVTSCALLATFLRSVGGSVVPRVARRDAGYGFKPADVDSFAAAGCRLIVTADCGTSDRAALSHARALPLDVIVVDHHQVPDGDPGAYALINPHQPTCRFPFKGLASVGICFYLAAALRTRLRALRPAAPSPDPRELLDLVAVGTVADLAPLTDENRVLVAAGLRELARGRRPGLQALAERAALDTGRLPTTTDIGFKLAPRLNAPGRLGDAQLALDLLLADGADAVRLAGECDDANRARQQVQEGVMIEAFAQVEAQLASRGAPLSAIVAAGEGWHSGVVGIVAAKLVDRYHVPSVVIALSGEEGRGSARSADAFHLFHGLARCQHLLTRFGGHAAAAGLSLVPSQLDAFRGAFEAAVVQHLEERAAAGILRGRPLRIDAEVAFDEVDERLVEELAGFAPFGMGNPEPVLGTRGLSLDHVRVVKERHLQVTLSGGRTAHDGIGFNLAASAAEPGARVAAAFFPEHDVYRGVRRLRLRLRLLAGDGDP